MPLPFSRPLAGFAGLAALSAALFAAPAAHAADFQDGFENGPWYTETVGGFQVDPTVAHSGSQSVKVVGGNTGQYMSSAPITVQPHTVYRVSVWIKSDLQSSAPAISLNVLQGNANQEAVGWYPQGDLKLIQTGGRQNWTHYTTTLDGLDPATAFVKLYLRLDAGAPGTVWFDDVTLSAVNQVAEPGFERALWPYAQGRWSRTSTERHSGQYAAKVTASGAESYLFTDGIPVAASEGYDLSLWVKSSNAAANSISINALQLDAKDNALGWYQPGGNPALVRTGGTQGWTRYAVKLRGFSPGTAKLRLYLRQDAAAGGTAWFDDVVLTPSHRDGFQWGVSAHANTSSAVYPRHQLTAQLDKAKSLGIGLYRTNLSPRYDPVRQSYDWSYLDEVVEGAYARGMKVYLVLLADANNDSELPHDAQGRPDFFAYGRAVAEHYRGKVAYYQLANELERDCIRGEAYDGDQPSHYDDRYFKVRDFIRAFGDGIRAGDPDAKRALNIGWLHTGFLQRLNSDGVKWEVTGYDWYREVDPMMSVLNILQGFPQQEILIAESNRNEGSLNGKEAEQAAYITQVANEVYHRAPSKVRGYLVYELLDQSNIAGGEGSYGLVHYDSTAYSIGSDKPAFGAYKRVIAGKP